MIFGLLALVLLPIGLALLWVWRDAKRSCPECSTPIDADGHCPCNPPFVCPGCYAVGGEPCAGYCPDAAIERDREEDRARGGECECGMCSWCAERDDHLEEYDHDDFSA